MQEEGGFQISDFPSPWVMYDASVLAKATMVQQLEAIRNAMYTHVGAQRIAINCASSNVVVFLLDKGYHITWDGTASDGRGCYWVHWDRPRPLAEIQLDKRK